MIEALDFRMFVVVVRATLETSLRKFDVCVRHVDIRK